MNVFIITEGSREIGLGHVTRCMSLYQAFEDKDILPKFIVYTDNSLNHLFKNKRYESFKWIIEQKKLLKLIKNADVVIIDSYLADYAIYEEISKLVKIPVYIDDNRRLDYPEGIVINGSIYAEYLNYPQKEGVKYLLGPDYIMLRQEFWNIFKESADRSIKNIMLTFGGDDSRNMTPKVLNLLNSFYPELNKTVIVGPAFENIEEIEKLKDSKTKLIYHPDADEMKYNMLKSDIAISAGGQTLYELARIGIPTITVSVASNQINNVNYCKQAGFVKYAGLWNDKKLLKNIIKNLKSLENEDLRLKMSNIGKSYVKGNGPAKIVEYCIKMFYKSKYVDRGAEYGI